MSFSAPFRETPLPDGGGAVQSRKMSDFGSFWGLVGGGEVLWVYFLVRWNRLSETDVAYIVSMRTNFPGALQSSPKLAKNRPKTASTYWSLGEMWTCDDFIETRSPQVCPASTESRRELKVTPSGAQWPV
jgi:hypothetical protein